MRQSRDSGQTTAGTKPADLEERVDSRLEDRIHNNVLNNQCLISSGHQELDLPVSRTQRKSTGA
ncbi:hypothetical protein PCANC_14729 [Puccinia coronata f. sp. avenae]|uniref:Uncharacterized protein n=1 Tax=Puccinia coronata f. sp. avenae TaxID=200324 RepID=A0A2N5SXT2_9BASI|nr:hypothetical protein PCANC_14729 [Puccinia coronata f. sp. avenae]PLW43526.1 hypothetical protein PCASD_06738 [Puccinia coronata f. sp. avenae]